MSGPKTSQYTLTPEQRRILAEQRKIRTQCEHLVKLQKDTRSIVVHADRIIEKVEPLWQEIHADTSVLDQAKALRVSAMDAINIADQLNENSGLSMLQDTNKALREISRKLETLTKSLQNEHSNADQAFRKRMSERISDGFDIYFDDLGNDQSMRDPYFIKIQTVLSELATLSISNEQQNKLQAIQAKANDIESIDFLKNYYTMTILPFAKECRAYHTGYSAYGEIYEQKRFTYESNARTLGIEIEEIPFSLDAVSLLDAKIQETEVAIQHRDEQAYISRCVDEAMQEMGYSVLGNREVVKRNGKRFRNELYLFDEGTAVNVTYSNDGQITMELGGIAMDDHIPSNEESVSLVSDMRTFCDDYYEIERRLRKKGVITKRISILPPDAQFAQIINVSDYNLCTEVSEFEAKTTHAKTGKTVMQKIGE